jgi:LCP family protein required for cell wall assembly
MADTLQHRNPWIAGGLSVLVPGLGHVYLRSYKRALVWFTPVVVAAVLVLVLSRTSPTDLVEAALSPSVLWSILGINALAAVWRIIAAVDAFRGAVGADAGWMAPLVLVGAFIAAMFIAIPHVFIGNFTVDALRFVDIVFVDDGEVPETPVIPIGTDADVVPDPVVQVYEYRVEETVESVLRGRIFDPKLGDPEAVEVWRRQFEERQQQAPNQSLLPYAERVGDGRITILLAGGDAGPGRGGLRTDSMIVATIDPATGKAALFGFPRNLGSMPLPRGWGNAFQNFEKRLIAIVADREGATATSSTSSTVPGSSTSSTTTTVPPFVGCRCFPEQLNALYPFTRKWTSTYPNEPDPGMAALSDVLENAMGLRIDYYALVDMAAFVDLVDAIGGVDIYALEPLESEVSPPREGDPWAKVDVDIGWSHLDGPEALAFVRARRGSSDYVRMARQRCMLRAIAAKSTPVTLLRSFGGIVDAVDGTLVTDIPVSFAPDLLAMTANLDFGDVVTVGFNPGYYAPGRDFLGHFVPDIGRIRGKVARVLNDQESGVEPTGDAAVSECDG